MSVFSPKKGLLTFNFGIRLWNYDSNMMNHFELIKVWSCLCKSQRISVAELVKRTLCLPIAEEWLTLFPLLFYCH